MTREERQSFILNRLQSATQPVRGDDLALALGVTRQVIVHEIALLRAAGQPIVSTPRGYRLDGANRTLRQRTIMAVRHSADETADELFTLVDHGLVVHNVMVEHPIYGQIEGSLELASRIDVESFLAQLQADGAALLSSLTDGYHLHGISFRRPEDVDRARDALRQLGIEVLD